MVSHRKTLAKALSGSNNIRFGDMTSLVEAFGFRHSRTSGSHNIFVHPEIPEVVNLQNVKGQTKPYRVRQFLRLVERYNLTIGGDER